MGAVLGRRRAARPGAGDRPDRHLAVADPHQDLGRRADDLEVLEVEIAQERRRIDAPQRAVEREGGQREGASRSAATAPPGRCRRRGCTPSPRSTMAENSSGVVFETGGSKRSRVGSRPVVEGQGPLERPGDALEPRQRRSRRPPCAETPGLRPHGRDEGDLVAHGVEHHHHGRPDQDRVGNAERVRIRRRAGAPSAAPCRSRDSRTGPPPWAAGRRRAAGRSRRSAPAGSSSGARSSGTKALADRAPARSSAARPSWQRQTRSGSSPIIEKRPAHRAALDRFEQEGRARRGRCRSFRKAATGVRRSPTSVARSDRRLRPPRRTRRRRRSRASTHHRLRRRRRRPAGPPAG